MLNSVVGDAVSCDRAGGIEEDIVRPRISRGIDPQRELVSRRESDVELREPGIAKQLGRIEPRLLRQLRGAGKHQGLVIGLIVTGCGGPGCGLRSYKRLSVYETHNRGLVKNVLVESRKEERAIPPKRASNREPELVLLLAWFHGKLRIACVKAAITQEIKTSSVEFVRAGFCDDIHDSAGAPP